MTDPRRYLDNTTSILPPSSTDRKSLTGLVFAKNSKIPIKQFKKFTSLKEVADLVGKNDPLYKFAEVYFYYQVPRGFLKAPDLLAYHWDGTESPAEVYGSSVNVTLDDLAKMTQGELTFKIDEDNKEYTVNIDFEGDVTWDRVVDDLTTVIKSRMNGRTFTVSFDDSPVFMNFNVEFYPLKSGGISFIDKGGKNDVGKKLGLVGDKVVVKPAVFKDKSPLAVLKEAYNISDNFGTLTFLDDMNVANAVEVAEFIAEKNVKHQLYFKVNAKNAQDWSKKLINIPSVGLFLANGSEFPQALSMAIISATNYNQPNATVGHMFRHAGDLLPASVVKDEDADKYDALRINYIGETSSAGTKIVFLQRGYLCGDPKRSPVDMSIHANEQWLKGEFERVEFNLFLNSKMLPANSLGSDIVNSALTGAILLAKSNGVISSPATLDDGQKLQVVELTGSEDAINFFINNGYYLSVKVGDRKGESGLIEKYIDCLFIYKAGEYIRKIEGKNIIV